MMPNVVLGIPSYNGSQRLDWLLRSIALRTPLLETGTVRIVLVDDGSPRVDETRKCAQHWAQKLPLTFIEHGTNRGISAGWNTAVRATNAEICVLLNDDVIVASGGWLEALVYALEHSPGVGVVGQSWHAFLPEDASALLASVDSDLAVIPRDPVSKIALPERRTLYEDTHPGRVMCPTGQLFAFRRSDFDAIGGFDETYKSMYEESCFGTSMAVRGLIGMQTTWPFCFHLWSATFAQNPELDAGGRIAVSRAHYRKKWGVPEYVPEFEHTNATYFNVIGDVAVEVLTKTGVRRGVLRQDGAFVEAT
jgi:glycosyltransferase involved in cell wall biosynthesis